MTNNLKLIEKQHIMTKWWEDVSQLLGFLEEFDKPMQENQY
jgi:hypothetical protein